MLMVNIFRNLCLPNGILIKYLFLSSDVVIKIGYVKIIFGHSKQTRDNLVAESEKKKNKKNQK